MQTTPLLLGRSSLVRGIRPGIQFSFTQSYLHMTVIGKGTIPVSGGIRNPTASGALLKDCNLVGLFLGIARNLQAPLLL